ncbi:hypothetical protein HYDPIDRAFT_107154 [Hydnomerulius pinastri MD-312]|nr:hypothetical protein HYDPIDRAFT_107154 [Hydnomerulius pinastri MD-312]
MLATHHTTQDQREVQNQQSFSISQASLSSSFSSSTASSMLLPAAPLSTSSHSDTTTSDHLASAHSTTFKSISGGPVPSHPPRSSPPTSSMGQVVSRPQVTSTLPSSSTPSSLGNAASNTGSRFKRAFVGRRKKSDVVTPSSASSPKSTRAREPHSDDSPYGSTNSAPRQLGGAKQLTLQLQHVFSKKHTGSAPASPAMSGLSLPPPPPPKHAQQLSLSLPSSRLAPVNTNVDKRLSVMTTSSPIAPALDYMRRSDDHIEHVTAKENSESKEIRRKSDSTLSHHTIRPGLGSRTPRPVSLAESLQSTNTIMPVNKRLSALITEAEYVMPEEEDGERSEEKGRALPRSVSPGRRASPASSLKVRDRRSQSLNLGPPLSLMVSAPTAANASMSLDAIPATLPRSMSEERERLVTRETAAATFSSLPLNAVRPAGLALRANFLSPNTVDLRSNSPLSRVERTLPELPQPPRRSPLAPEASHTPPSFRQTAISMTAPAAGLARRAVEKMGRVLGNKSLSPSPLASPVGNAPSSFPIGRAGPLSRASSGHSESTHHGHGKKSRHNPNTPSVSSTGSSISDHEGPQLGKRLRGPVRISPTGAGVAGGLVFGRDLRTCVKDTAIDPVRSVIHARRFGHDGESEESDDFVQRSEPSASLESRYVPAIVVRCAQHILAWGVQEQGLFRVSGRSSHVAKLRADFDTGADFDIVQSNPGDLDPHAVASIFKAYLRELPEPILTNSLMPYFDAAMASERQTNNAQDPAPASPKNIHPGLRKPPSLSTLSMPSFGGAHPPSDSLRKALTSLIARLPQENRDLLLTVTEVINHTAKRSSETKMPLSNLLLVLCPSLNMNPSLLQALCESEGIWNGIQPSREVQTLDAITEDVRQSPVERSEVRGEDNASPVAEKSATHSRSSNESKRLRPLPNVPVEDALSPPAAVVANSPVNIQSPILPLSEPSRPRPSLETMGHVATDSSETSSSFTTTDDSSSVSHRPITPTSVNFKLTNPYCPPSLSSSTDSLSTPSLSSGSPITMYSAKHLPLMDEFSEPQSSTSPHSPVIAEPIPLPIPPPKTSQPTQQTIAPQFQFPSTGDHVMRSPLSHRKSTPSMSFSSSISGDARSGSLASRAKRLKKPSLHLLFSKRSASPLTSPTQSPAVGASPLSAHPEGPSRYSSASESSPESMVTAPQSSRFSYPPVLNTAIDESSISLALGIEDDEEDHTTSVGHTIKDGVVPSHVSFVPNAPGPHGRTSPPPKPGKQGPFRHLDVAFPEDSDFGEGDWTQSVLLAAGESSW